MNALIVTAIFSDLIDHRYWRAAAFCFVAIWLSMFGVMHSNNLQGHSIGADGRATQGEVTWAKRAPGNEGWRFAIAYSVVCAGLIASHFLQKAGFTVATRRLHFTSRGRRDGVDAPHEAVPRRRPCHAGPRHRGQARRGPRKNHLQGLGRVQLGQGLFVWLRRGPARGQGHVHGPRHLGLEMGASCTYSSHVKSHAAHSPASTFASA